MTPWNVPLSVPSERCVGPSGGGVWCSREARRLDTNLCVGGRHFGRGSRDVFTRVLTQQLCLDAEPYPGGQKQER